MKEHRIDTATQGPSEFKCIDRRGNAGTDMLVILDFENGSGIASLEFTPDDCIDNDPTFWIEHDVLSDATESCASTLNVPFTAFRVNVKRLDSGTVTARIVQGGYHDF